MGQAKKRSQGRKRVLEDNKYCIYCGDWADTTDHCPPRCFFEGRHWPEGYEFSACSACNQEARADEQILAVLVRMRVFEQRNEAADKEWEKLLAGVQNNQPEMLAEWNAASSRNEQRRSIRDKFGKIGDDMRRAGYGALSIGPLTRAAIRRFRVKLAKALYFRHNHQIFDGVIYARHISALEKDWTPASMQEVLQLAPETAISQRNQKSLADQL